MPLWLSSGSTVSPISWKCSVVLLLVHRFRASSARCAIQTAHVRGGFHLKVPHLALLPANKSTEWTPDSLDPRLLSRCFALWAAQQGDSLPQPCYQPACSSHSGEGVGSCGKGEALLFVNSGNWKSSASLHFSVSVYCRLKWIFSKKINSPLLP